MLLVYSSFKTHAKARRNQTVLLLLLLLLNKAAIRPTGAAQDHLEKKKGASESNSATKPADRQHAGQRSFSHFIRDADCCRSFFFSQSTSTIVSVRFWRKIIKVALRLLISFLFLNTKYSLPSLNWLNIQICIFNMKKRFLCIVGYLCSSVTMLSHYLTVLIIKPRQTFLVGNKAEIPAVHSKQRESFLPR